MNENCNKVMLSIIIGTTIGMIMGALIVTFVTYKIVTNSFISQYDHELEVNTLAKKIDKMYRYQDELDNKLELEVKSSNLKSDRIITLEKRLYLDQ
jgi:hypothetical protein